MTFKKLYFSLLIFSLIHLPLSAVETNKLIRNLRFDSYSNLLLSGWNPLKNNSYTKKKANAKTIKTLNTLKEIPVLQPYFKRAKGYAIYPKITKAGIGIGGARGKGEVFEGHRVIGSTILTQLSVGFQLGGQSFSQIIFFKDKKSLNRFTQGNFEFDASASAALITEGAIASLDYNDGVAIMTFSNGGLMYEASVGGQKFSFERY